MESLFLFFAIIFLIISALFFFNVLYLLPIYILIKLDKTEFMGFKKIIGTIDSKKLIKTQISKTSVVYNQIYFEEYIIDNSSGGDGERIYIWKPIKFICSNNDFSIITKDKKIFNLKSSDIDKFNFLVDNKEIGIINNKNEKEIKKIQLNNFLNENNIGSSKIKIYELGTKRCIEKYLSPKKEITVILKNKDIEKYKIIYITDKGALAIFDKIKKSFYSSVILGSITLVIGIFILFI